MSTLKDRWDGIKGAFTDMVTGEMNVKRATPEQRQQLVELAEDAVTVGYARGKVGKGRFTWVRNILRRTGGKPEGRNLEAIVEATKDIVESEYKDSSERDWRFVD